MFPNVRLMAASTLVSVMALFFAFGVYASLRVSHAPLARSSRAAPLQLVGFNVAMLPVTVLEPFADKHPAPTAADNSAALAYSAPQAVPPQVALPVTVTPDAHADNAAADEPAENSDVTQMQITGALETAREPKAPEAPPQDSAAPVESVEQSSADAAPPPALPSVVSPTAAAPPQIPPAERTAAIETTPAAVAEPAAATDDTADDTDIVPKKSKKKRHIARRHFYRIPLRAVAQTSAPQQQSSIWPAGIGGPLVVAPKH
jgi:hypothetical protein